MHFLPRQLKRHSFSCGVSRIDPMLACRRCGGCPLIIAAHYTNYALSVTRYMRTSNIHKQSFGHPWPSSDPLTPACFIPSVDKTGLPQSV